MKATRLALVTGVAVAAVTTAGASAVPSSARPPEVKQAQKLASLLKPHTVVSAPHRRPSRIARIPAWRPITGGRTVLPVTGRTTTKDGVRWLQVRVPGRPNSRKGWIAKRATVLSSTPWHLVVRTSTRRVRVYRRGRLARTFAAIVGKPSTPTPHGRFFVEESVRMLAGSAGGPFALATSARSNVLQEFEGGPGQVALHGVANLGGTPGTAVSHGCVRLANGHITWLAERIAPGVPVTIKR
jgi:lipoprotein-anchoring transpeptidase ErfK/SrfK